MVIHLTEENFEDTISAGDVVLVDFWASWCGPCKMVSPLIDQLSEEVGSQTVIAKVDTDENPALAQKLGIASIPAVKVFQGGVEVDSIVGAVPLVRLKGLLSRAGVSWEDS
jgi:thioredoxin 1